MNDRLRVEGFAVLPYKARGGIALPRGGENKLVACVLPEKKLNAHRTEVSQETGQLERRNAVDSEHRQRVGICTQRRSVGDYRRNV